MKEKCPVCETDCEKDATKCGNCGFEYKPKIDMPWLNVEDGNLWLKNVVIPYRTKWRKESLEKEAERKKREKELLPPIRESPDKNEDGGSSGNTGSKKKNTLIKVALVISVVLVILVIFLASYIIFILNDDGRQTHQVDASMTQIPPPTISNIPVINISLDRNEITLGIAETHLLTEFIDPWNATNKDITWSSSNDRVATVSNLGVVTAVSAGIATITVRTADGSYTDTCRVTVREPTTSQPSSIPVSGISLDRNEITLEVAGSQSLTPIVAPPSATNINVTWSSSNDRVATVNSSGRVTAVAAGTATITARAADGGYTVTCRVIVTPPRVSGITLDRNEITLVVAGSQSLIPTVAPTNATNKNVTWNSSNTNVATVNSSGRVTAVAAGTATITVRTEDGGYTATTRVTVSQPTIRVSGISLDRNEITLEVAGSQSLIPTVVPTNAANKNVTWNSSNINVATVNSSGRVTAVSAGTATITVRTADGSYTATTRVTVSQPTIRVSGISFTSNEITLRIAGSQSLSYTITPSNAANKNVTWNSSNTDVATVSSSGVVTAVSAGTATITVRTADGSYTATTRVIVAPSGNFDQVQTPRVSGIALDSNEITLRIAGSQQLYYTITPSNAANRNVTWNSSNTDVATVSSSGVVTAVSAGTATITVRTADGGYTAATRVIVAPGGLW
jgi:uncharacterized protein YjdB